MLRIQSRLFRPGFGGVDATGFVQWSVSLLARGRRRRASSTPWTAAAPSVTFDDEANPSHVVEVVAFEQDGGPAFERESHWYIHWSDSIAGMTEHVTGPTERYRARLALPSRFELLEESDARGWARVLDVRSRDPVVTRAIRDRFRAQIANPDRIPPWERERVLEEEVVSARALAASSPERGDYRRSAAARERQLRKILARGAFRDWEEASWPWPWIEASPRLPPRPPAIQPPIVRPGATGSLEVAPADAAPAVAAPIAPSAWRSVPCRHDGSRVRLAEFLAVLGRLFGAPGPSPVWTTAEGVSIDDPRWNDLTFGLRRVRDGAREVVWTSGDRVVCMTLAERPGWPVGMDPAPQEPGVWYTITARGLADGASLEAETYDEPSLCRYRALGPEQEAARVCAALESALARSPA